MCPRAYTLYVRVADLGDHYSSTTRQEGANTYTLQFGYGYDL